MLLAFCGIFLLKAEPFRVRKTNLIAIDSLFEKKSVEAGVNDAVVIKLPEDKTFIEGIEISIKVPKIKEHSSTNFDLFISGDTPLCPHFTPYNLSCISKDYPIHASVVLTAASFTSCFWLFCLMAVILS